jgi:glycosyltransferase involved in cell wall biosynthesis
VRFLGARSDVAHLLLRADCFVLPSANEAQCIALIEALAAGLPIIASDIPGNRFSAGHPGVFLSDFQDIQACARSAMHLMSLGCTHARDMRNFDVEAKAQQYIDFAIEAFKPSSTRGGR